MGAWGVDIMSNDETLDCIGFIGDELQRLSPEFINRYFYDEHLDLLFFGLEELKEAPSVVIHGVRDLINEHLDKLVKVAGADNPDGLQALGCLIMAVGAEMPEALRESIIRHGVEEASTIDALRQWREQAKLRYRVLMNFKHAVLNHQPGQQWFEDTKSFLDALEELYD